MTKSTRAAVLLDVDGVLNPARRAHAPGPSGYRPHLLRPKVFPGMPAREVEVWLDPEHGRMLRELAAATGAELVWATTWEHEAARLLAPLLDLPPLAVITFGVAGARRTAGHAGKSVAVRAWAGARPLCWFDDEFTPADQEWAARRSERDAPTSLIPVEARAGLTADHLARARAFLDSLPTAQ